MDPDGEENGIFQYFMVILTKSMDIFHGKITINPINIPSNHYKSH